MEIPQSGPIDLDYLFEFSPDQDQGSGGAKKGVNPVKEQNRAVAASSVKVEKYKKFPTNISPTSD